MNSDFFSTAFLWTCLWQTSLCLSIGLTASYVFLKRPSRAHHILVLAVAASVIAPLFSHIVDRYELGILPSYSQEILRQSELSTNNDSTLLSNSTSSIRSVETTKDVIKSSPSSSYMTTIKSPEPSISKTKSFPTYWNVVSKENLLSFVWMAMIGFFLFRFIQTLFREFSIFRRVRKSTDNKIVNAVQNVSELLQLKRMPNIYESDYVQCPMICCWGIQPSLILPNSIIKKTSDDGLQSLICHELAHWKRRDYWIAFFVEIVCCVYPWQPLIWLTRQKIRQFSEMACDNWVLACGQPADSYAESLLNVLPQKNDSFALAAVNHRKNLEQRLLAIIDGNWNNPISGKKWMSASTIIMFGIVTLLAMVQQGAAVTEKNDNLNIENEIPISKAPSVRMIRDNYRYYMGAVPSWSGKYFAFTDYYDVENKPVHVYERETRKIVATVNLGETGGLGVGGIAYHPIVSFNDKYTAFSHSYKKESGRVARITILDIKSKNHKIIYESEPYCDIRRLQWCADNQHLCVEQSSWDEKEEKHFGEVFLISIVNQSIKNITPSKYFGYLWAYEFSGKGVFISPDLNYLLYNYPVDKKDPNNGGCDIYLYDIAEKKEKIIMNHRFKNNVVGWSPDGKWILYTSERYNITDLWGLPFLNNQINDFPVPLFGNIGDIVPYGFSKDYSLYFAKSLSLSSHQITGRQQVYIASLGNMEEINFSALKPIGNTEVESPVNPSWSPDGKLLSYICSNSNITNLIIETVDSNNIEKFNDIFWPHWDYKWGKDGESIYCLGWDVGDESDCAIFKINLKDLSKTRVVHEDEANGKMERLALSATNSYLCYTIGGWNNEFGALIKHDLESDKRTVLYTGSDKEGMACGYVSISPDEKHIAFCTKGYNENFTIVAYKLNIVSTDGGDPLILFTYQDSKSDRLHLSDIEKHPSFLFWDKDGQHVIFTLPGKEENTLFYKVSINGGEPTIIHKLISRPGRCAYNPATNQIALQYSLKPLNKNGFSTELWKLENFLPKGKSE